jgi:hypothetical protein
MKFFPFFWAGLLTFNIIMMAWYLFQGHLIGVVYLPLIALCAYKFHDTLKYLRQE